MPNMSEAEFEAYKAKHPMVYPVADKPGRQPPRRESELHKLILNECHRRELLAFHGSTAHRTRRTLGEPDFVILLPGSRVLLIECKTATGTISDDQARVILHANRLGHPIHLVRSFADFHKILTLTLELNKL